MCVSKGESEGLGDPQSMSLNGLSGAGGWLSSLAPHGDPSTARLAPK